ncbi:hypothetical protein ACFPYJ_11445 [Paenibacillus solisilvae]|uniref:MacB-like periplasmic core domain-containing protein n=1 Tax=Paenibacillus solisilvae TaxID=2486751 RepID=A0ABW0VY09_9BACL
MVMVINKKVRRTMLESKAQYFGSLVLIAISCMLYTLFNQLGAITSDGASAFEKDYVQEDASFITDKKLNNIPELESQFGMIIEEGESFDYAVTKEKTLRVFAETTKVNKYAVIKGRTLSGSDMLLDPAYAKANDIKIGDTVSVRDHQFTVSGFMSLPNYIYPLKKETDVLNAPGSFGIAVIGRDDYASFNTDSSFYSVKVAGDRNNVDGKLAELKDSLKNENVVILKWIGIEENPRVTLVTSKLENMKSVGAAMPVAICCLHAF